MYIYICPVIEIYIHAHGDIYICLVGKNNPERIGELEAFNRELCTSRLMLRCDEISGRWHIKDFSFTTSLFDRGCVFIVNDTRIHSLRLVRGFCYLSRLVKTGGTYGK